MGFLDNLDNSQLQTYLTNKKPVTPEFYNYKTRKVSPISQEFEATLTLLTSPNKGNLAASLSTGATILQVTVPKAIQLAMIATETANAAEKMLLAKAFMIMTQEIYAKYRIAGISSAEMDIIASAFEDMIKTVSVQYNLASFDAKLAVYFGTKVVNSDDSAVARTLNDLALVVASYLF